MLLLCLQSLLCLTLEERADTVHEAGEALGLEVAAYLFLLAVGDKEALSGTRHGDIEFARVFCHLGGIVIAFVVGQATINNIKYDDIVELQSLGFVNGCDEDAVAYGGGTAKVGFLECVEFHAMPIELLAERGVTVYSYHVIAQVA